MTDGVPRPLANTRRQMLAVQADDARFVNHLGKDQHGIWSLHDLLAVVIEVIWQHGRSRRPSKSQKAPLRERPPLRTGEVLLGLVPKPALDNLWPGHGTTERSVPSLRFGRHRRNLALRRINDDGRSILPIHHRSRRSGIKEDAVIPA